ncbi:MAG: 4Fe-4S dicluster domain-containing protein [Candidatus Omnitrophota bacterium]
MQRIITKEELSSTLKELLKEYEVIAPKDLSNKGIFYQEISDVADLCLGGGFAIEPIKKFFLEPCSRICKHSQDDGAGAQAIEQPQKKRIIIGARPCEARGLELLDKIFDGELKDSFYINNRARTLIVGLACNEPDGCCFCTSMSGSPVETRGMDALLFDFADTYVVAVITEKAKNIFGSFGKELDAQTKRSWEKDNEKRINSLQKKISPPKSMDDIFQSDYWKEASQSCLSCGICTFLCPTCHCFDLIDEERKMFRCYDGCAFPDFTLEASGGNPRPGKKERYRQRVYHKFDYFKKNFGENLCVGCGRCIRHCPVKIDIAEIVANAPISG